MNHQKLLQKEQIRLNGTKRVKQYPGLKQWLHGDLNVKQYPMVKDVRVDPDNVNDQNMLAEAVDAHIYYQVEVLYGVRYQQANQLGVNAQRTCFVKASYCV